MKTLNKIVRYTLKKRKRSLLSALCCMIFVYAGIQLIYLHNDYSPLQLLSSVENEASRLLRFMGQTQVQCNNSLPTNNVSMWMLCQDAEFGIKFSDSEKDNTVPLVYSLGPTHDFNFENFVSKNLSTRLYIFSHLADKLNFLSKINPSANTIFKTAIVPNDPSDFARNSYETQTLNLAMQNLKHKEIDILKVDTLVESVTSYEFLKFLIDDGVLLHVKELHIVITLDKLEEDFIYSWYRVLYALFHTAGFRLYHTASSEPLCLEDTMMESCKYYLSWIRDLPPHVFVTYPPAIDGSFQHERERIDSYLDVPAKENIFQPVKFKLLPASHQKEVPLKDMNKQHHILLYLSKQLLANNAQPCNIIFILDIQFKDLIFHANHKNTGCKSQILVLAPSDPITQNLQFYSMSTENKTKSILITVSQIQQQLEKSATNILYIEMHDAWEVIDFMSRVGLPKLLHQIIVRTSLTSSGSTASLIRRRYSKLRQIEAFQLKLVASDKETYLQNGAEHEFYVLNFVKEAFL